MEAAAFAPDFELSRVRVRLICAEERVEWDTLIRTHHYLGLTAMVGRSLRYVAEIDGRWLALLGWASPALKCASRDHWIGWSPTLQWQRLALIANNSRFLILPGVRVKNLASRILGLNLARLSQDWLGVHGHRLLLAETFIDPSRFVGTCYRAANWIDLGSTRGFAKSNATYTRHGTPKRIWVFPLHPQAPSILSAAAPHPQLPRLEVKMMTLSDTDAHALFARLGTLEDPRARRGRRHHQRSLLATILCAVVSGAQGSTAISEWVKRLPTAMLRRLRCRRAADASYERPSEPTIRRMLMAVDIEQLERQLGGWLQTQGVINEPVALDGKILRGTRAKGQARAMVSAFGHHSHVVLNQVEVADKASELKAVKPLLDPIPLAGRVVTADALHTQVETARYLVEDQQAHYLFTVKDNQPTLKADIASLHMEAAPPEHVTLDKAHGRVEIRRIWTSERLNDYLEFPHAAQVACVEREVFEISRNKTRLERVYLISSQTRAQASAEQLLALNRGHWGIENKLHYVRDVAYDEDRCRARKGNTPRTLACLRNFAISLLRWLHVPNIKAALRDLAANVRKIFTMLRL